MAHHFDPDILDHAAHVLAEVPPWRGMSPSGRTRNYLGAVSPDESVDCDDLTFEPIKFTEIEPPLPSEGFFEFYSLLSSIHEADSEFVAVSLGAHYGGPLVDAVLALRQISPMPYKLIGVEADPYMIQLLRQHFRDHGIDARDHCIINAAVGATAAPVLFTTSDVRTGANVAFHDAAERESIYQSIARVGLSEAVLKNLLVNASIGLKVPLWAHSEAQGELELVSTITLNDVLSLCDRVDYLEIDIQSSERHVLPPARSALNRRVCWVHLGTHGRAIHAEMRALFEDWGWRVIADVLPEAAYETPVNKFVSQDGVIIARNPAFPLTQWSDVPLLQAA